MHLWAGFRARDNNAKTCAKCSWSRGHLGLGNLQVGREDNAFSLLCTLQRVVMVKQNTCLVSNSLSEQQEVVGEAKMK